MFGRTGRNRKSKPSRGVRLEVESLEERWVPHTGVSLFSTGLTTAAAPAGIVQGPDNNRWFTEFNASKIARITTGGVITEFTLPAGRGPVNITVGPDNNLWFTENTGDRIGRINPTAGSDAAIQASIVEFTVPGAGSKPNDITTGPDGALWFTETGADQIGRITTAGVVTEFAVPGVGSAPGGITAGADGALWFTEAGSGQIGRITTAGAVTEFTIPVPNAGSFSDPEDIVAGPGGNLFFTDFGRDQIGRITTSGQITQFNLPLGRGPHDIVAFSDGDLYFTETASSRIGRLPASALAVGAPTSGTPPLEEFDFIARDSAPLGISISETGDIWFTLNNGNAVGNFLAHLQQLTATSTGPTVQIVDVHFNPVRTFTPFAGYNGNLSLSVSDTNRNGIPDTIVGVSSPGGAPAVAVFDGSDNRVLASFFAFDPGYRGGITVTSEDVNGDGYADIIVAAGVGASAHIKVIDGTKLGTNAALFGPISLKPSGEIADSALLASFFAFDPGFLGGVSLAAGDINVDGKNDIIVAAGVGASAHIKVIDGTKLNQILANGQIADSALLGSFFAFDPGFKGGVSVAVSKNVVRRDIIVGAGAGAGPQVIAIDGTKLNQVQANGQIANSALTASFFAFGPGFKGGVRVAADDLNFDGLAELIATAGPGAGPAVKVIDGTKLNQVQPDGQISDAALLDSTLVSTPGFTGGVNVASDADHRDGPIFGPPGINQPGGATNSRADINDEYIFQSPGTPANTVLGLTVSPFSSTGTVASFVPNQIYDFRVVNRDLVHATDDLVLRVTFGPPDAAAGGRQDVEVRALPAAQFAGSGGVLVKGFTGQNLSIRGVGGNGTAMFRAAEQDDPFIFDAAGFNRFLNGNGLSNGTTADSTAPAATRKYPSGTSNNGAGDSNSDGLGFDGSAPETPNYNAPNFFASANTLAIIIELPSTVLAGVPADTTLVPDQNPIGLWTRTEAGGVQLDRTGRPAINTALIPPVPRGPSIMNPAPDMRNAFNAGHPKDDLAVFGSAMSSVLAAVYPIGGNGQAPVVAGLLLPDMLVYDPTSTAGFFGDTVGTLGQPNFFLAGGRKLSDDVISIEVSILTDPDSPFNLDGGVNQPPLVTTQNVADDNGFKITDGSSVGPGSTLTGMVRPIAFPYIGARNTNPANVPGGNPPQ